jgi:hypothetical protein
MITPATSKRPPPACVDLRAELLRSAVDGQTVWTEWRYTGAKQATIASMSCAFCAAARRSMTASGPVMGLTLDLRRTS